MYIPSINIQSGSHKAKTTRISKNMGDTSMVVTETFFRTSYIIKFVRNHNIFQNFHRSVNTHYQQFMISE